MRVITNLSLFILVAILINPLSGWSRQTENPATETIDGKKFIIHEVVAKETVFSIARKYNVKPKLITEINPEAKQGLDIGQLLRIPLQRNNEVEKIAGYIHIVKEKETLFGIARKYEVSVKEIKEWNDLEDNTLEIGQRLNIKKVNDNSNEELIKPDFKSKPTHTVAEKETLYGISRQYGVSISQIKEWNNLESNEIDLGQQLIVGEKKEVEEYLDSSAKMVDEVRKNIRDSVQNEVNDVIADASENVENQPENNVEDSPEQVAYDSTYFETKTVKNANGFDETVQNGLAELIEGSEDNRKYLALHRTAKVGTIMKVRNEMNNKMVFVRVLGRIPDTGDNDKVLIKLSKAAYKRLGALDKRFRVELTYMP